MNRRQPPVMQLVKIAPPFNFAKFQLNLLFYRSMLNYPEMYTAPPFS
jgi:hypothetical protein